MNNPEHELTLAEVEALRFVCAACMADQRWYALVERGGEPDERMRGAYRKLEAIGKELRRIESIRQHFEQRGEGT